MLYLLLTILLFLVGLVGTILIISLIIVVHELGHYYAARLCGLMSCSVNIGFGRILYRIKDVHKTLWQLNLWPLGGYVDLCGKSKAKINKFLKLSYPKKVFIMLGGIIVNVMCAVLLFWCCNSLGYEYKKTEVGTVIKPTLASQSGMLSGDLITEMNGNKIITWKDVAFNLILTKAFGDKLTIQVIRSDQPVKLKTISIQDLSLLDKGGLFNVFGILPRTEKWRPVIGSVTPDSPAQLAGLQKGDQVTSIGNITINNANELLSFIREHPNQTVKITFIRAQKKYTKMVDISSQGFISDTGYLGIKIAIPDKTPALYGRIDRSALHNLTYAIYETYQYVLLQFATLYLLFTGSVSTDTLGGPVIILSMTFSLFSLQTLISLLHWIAVINISLAFINLLPIPVFDGGRILILTIERIMGKRIKPSTQGFIDRLTLSLLLGLFAMITYNDVARILGLL